MENEKNSEVVNIGEWLVNYLIASIHLVGIVMLFVWASGGETNQNKANWAKATLIWIAIIAFIYTVCIFLYSEPLCLKHYPKHFKKFSESG